MPQTTTLGGNATNVSVGKVAHGLMMMTWKPTSVPDEEAFEAIKTSLDSVPSGTKMILNSGEFYGMNPRTANLELVARFFEKYPEYTDKAFLSVKGAVTEELKPDCSPEYIRRSVDNIIAKLRGTKKVDLFQPARVDPHYPIESTMKVLAELVQEGKFDFIGISEAKAETLRRAVAVHPVAAIEIEVSPWSYFEETKKVISTAKELDVAVIAYSPLGRGYLVGRFQKLEDLEDGDFRKHLTRFQAENFAHNMAIVDGIKAISERKKITPAQLCIGWVSSLGSHVIPLPGSSNSKRTAENLGGGEVEITVEDIADINKIFEENSVKGGRSFGDAKDDAQTWG